VRHLTATGRWRRICRSVLVTHTGELTREQQLWIAVLSAGDGAVLAGLTAVSEAGVRGLRREPLYVIVPAGRIAPDLRRRLPLGMPGVVVKRTTHLPPEHLQIGRPTRTTTARGVVDAAQWSRTEDEARTVIAAACQQRRVTPEELLAVVDALTRARRRRLIVQTVQDVAGGAEALSEIDLIRLCRRHHLPVPDLQERRTDAAGRVRYLDACWRRWGLHVEVDGAHHMDVRHWAADMRRQNDIWIAGDRILRFPAWLVRRRPEEVAAQIEAALRAAGWRA
jgi:very-short-patch-repair endonuclease